MRACPNCSARSLSATSLLLRSSAACSDCGRLAVPKGRALISAVGTLVPLGTLAAFVFYGAWVALLASGTVLGAAITLPLFGPLRCVDAVEIFIHRFLFVLFVAIAALAGLAHWLGTPVRPAA